MVGVIQELLFLFEKMDIKIAGIFDIKYVKLLKKFLFWGVMMHKLTQL